MRSSLSRRRGFPRRIPVVELLEERSAATLLWIGAAGAMTPATPYKIIGSIDSPTRSVSEGVPAILTPTHRLTLLPAETGGSGGGSESPATAPVTSAPAPMVADPFHLQLDVFGSSASGQSGGTPAFSGVGLPGAVGGTSSFSVPTASFAGSGSAPAYSLGSAGQSGDALFAAVSASTVKAPSTKSTTAIATPAPGSSTHAHPATTSPAVTTSSSAAAPTTTQTAPSGSGSGGPLAGQTAPPVVVPLEDDPVVRTNPDSFGGDPMQGAFSESGVRYADGAVRLNFEDLRSDGFGITWGQTRFWTNVKGLAPSGTPNGSGFSISQVPYLLNQTPLLVVTGDVSVRPFDLSGSSYVGRFFLQDGLTHNTGASEFDLTDTSGDTLKFNDFMSSNPGLFKSFTDPNGNSISVVSYTSGQVGEVQRSTTISGTTYTESYLYSYLSSPDPNAGKLSSVVLRRKVGAGSYTTIRQVQYVYYGSSENHGNLGDLKTVAIQDGSGTTIDTEYYRYYTGETGGYVHGIKYYFDAASYARLKAVYSDPTTATDTQAAPYAQRYFEYDLQQRVTKEILQGAGASSGGLGTYTFSYGTFSTNTDGYNSWKYETTETLPDSNTVTVYTNYAGEVMLKDYHDATSGLDWRAFTEYDGSGRILLQAGPTSVTGYDSSYADLLHSVSGNYVYLSDTVGRIDTVDYYTSTTAGETTAGGVAGYEQDTKVQQGETGSAITVTGRQYFQHTANGVSVNPLATATNYRNTDGTGGETTSYSYTWFSGTTQMQSEAVSAPTISSSQNGPGSSDTSTVFFDTSERPIWSKDGDGYINYVAYDAVTGGVTKTITDVDTTQTSDFSNLPSGWSTPSGGGLHLKTVFVVDGLGRPTTTTDPLGDITYTVYLDTNHEVRTYPGWNSSTNLPTGPTQDIRIDRTNSYLEELTMTATPHLTGGIPDGTEAISSVQTLARQYISAGGQENEDDKYFNLSGVTYSTSAHIGTSSTNYYATTYAYDSRGRLNTTTLPTNTVETTNYDGLGRVTSTAVGTTTLSSTTTASFIYDNNTLGGSTAVGDGNLTQIIASPGGSAANRVTEMYYDWRDRLVATKEGAQSSEDSTTHRPIIYNTYDNLDEVTEVQAYDGDGVTITFTSGVPNAPSSSLLRAQTVTSFDDQGRVYKTQTYSVDPSTGSVSTYALTSQDWYNHRGEVIKTSSPGGQVDKSVYDGAGRETTHYISDGGGDSTWSDATNVTGDNVLSQIETTYDKDDNAIVVTDRARNHDETTTGALGNASTAPKARVSYTTAYFDLANRVTATVDVGTNGGSAYTRPSSAPSASDTVLLTQYAYTSADFLDSTTDPRGLVTKHYYDNLGRETKTVEAYDGGSQTATTNKTTEFTYDGSDHMLTLKADETGGAYEKTQWTYGVTTTGGSDVNSNDILANVQYPDLSTGNPSSSYQESDTVNALGETKTFTDRAGNVHTYTLDILGRVTKDAVTTLATGFDGSVRRIETAYDTQGNPYLITSYDAATGGNVVNQLQRAYNGLAQLTTEYQSHSGTVNTSTTPKVQYAYSLMSGGANHSRLTSITYPNGKVLNYNYGSSGSLADTISRLDSLSDTSGTLEQYSYLGLDTVVKRAHSQPGVDLTYIKQSGESNGDAGDQYTGLDRFARVVDQRWIVTANGTHTDRFQYGYDRDSNALYRNNLVNTAFGELYHASGAGNGYDNLNQLSGFLRGVLSASGGSGTPLDTVSSPSSTVSYSPDAVGNFSSITTNGTTQTRSANQQNEITSISGATTPTYDTNGNLTKDEIGQTYTYDAWNRLVTVKNSGGTTIASYKYDGIGRRIQETHSGTTNDLYLSAAWQVLEERSGGVSTATIQYLWSPVYVDALVLRDRSTANNGTLDERLWVQQDANWNVTALVNNSGSVVERCAQDAYGNVTYYNASWTSISASAYAWIYIHQGLRLDMTTGNCSTPERDYRPTIQRWLQLDPIRIHGGDTNFYRAEDDNPINLTDPAGLAVIIGSGQGGAWRYTGNPQQPFVPYVPPDPPTSPGRASPPPPQGFGDAVSNTWDGFWGSAKEAGYTLYDVGAGLVTLGSAGMDEPYIFEYKSSLFRGYEQALQQGEDGQAYLARAELKMQANIWTLGFYGLGEGVYDSYQTGDPAHYQRAAGGFLFNALTLEAGELAGVVKSPKIGGRIGGTTGPGTYVPNPTMEHIARGMVPPENMPKGTMPPLSGPPPAPGWTPAPGGGWQPPPPTFTVPLPPGFLEPAAPTVPPPTSTLPGMKFPKGGDAGIHPEHPLRPPGPGSPN